MKYIFIVFLLFGLSFELFAQQPSKFSYQFRVIAKYNKIFSLQKVSIRVNVLQGNINGNSVYEEIHQATTNSEGLVSIQIGGGSTNSGVFSKINWSLGNYFIKTETDPNGGSNYTLINSTQLLSVPFALFAENVIGTKGEKGEVGNAGPQGLPGNIGLQGIIGPKGNIGNSGDAGIKGIRGDDGIKGEQGTSVFSTGVKKGDMFYWNGSSWQLIPIGDYNGMKLSYCDSVPTWLNKSMICNGKISSIDCNAAKLVGHLGLGVPSKASISVPVNVEQGGVVYYGEFPSSGVLGLTLSVNGGPLKKGNDILGMRLSGVPTSSGTATFTVLVEGKTCNINVPVNPYKGYGENITDIDGNVYKTIYIGDQQWMASNLKTTKRRDGAKIENLQGSGSGVDKLYTSTELASVCPSGWHVPNYIDWEEGILKYLGGKDIAGAKMKEVGTVNWSSPNTGATNTSLFTALAYGYYDMLYRNIYDVGSKAYFWCNSVAGIDAFVYSLSNSDTKIGWKTGIEVYPPGAFSIRCIKD